MRKLFVGLILVGLVSIFTPAQSASALAPFAANCTNNWYDTTIPVGGALSGTSLTNTNNLNLEGNAEDRVWTAIRGLNNGSFVTFMDINYTQSKPGDWVNAWTNLGGNTYHAVRIDSWAGNLYIRVIGTDNNTYGRSLNATGWSPWYAVSVGTAAYYGTPYLTSTSIGVFTIFVRTANNQPEYRCYD